VQVKRGGPPITPAFLRPSTAASDARRALAHCCRLPARENLANLVRALPQLIRAGSLTTTAANILCEGVPPRRKRAGRCERFRRGSHLYNGVVRRAYLRAYDSSIAGLTNAAAPPYISTEMDYARDDEDIQRLAELGYRSFKVICQYNAWHQATTRNMWFYELGSDHFIAGRVTRWRLAMANRLHGRRLGESGPWGEKTSGSWHSLNHARAVSRSLHDIRQRLGAQGLSWRFDVHARK